MECKTEDLLHLHRMILAHSLTSSYNKIACG